MQQIINQFTDTIRTAIASKMPLRIRGGGSKDFYGGKPQGEILDTTAYRGIVDYEPTELVITARCGMPLAEIAAALQQHGQMLAFEPPHFGNHATLGGCIAAGLSGPRRAASGAVRDFVLGVRILDGRGHDLRFGGQVMKNVAGYDVSRLMTGSLGTLGLILEVSLKVLPLPKTEATLRFELAEDQAIRMLNQWAGKPLPISASAYTGGELGLRLSGAATAVESACGKLGGERIETEQARRFWTGIREQTDPFFESGAPLWRLSIKSTTPPLNLPGEQLIEWGGSLRWLKSAADAQPIRGAAAKAGGHATLFRAADKSAGVFHPLPPALLKVHKKLKQTFDPAGIFNPGRLYPEL
ncbi:MAG TPA: glycolate oxidase subunit GlcE [Burkholderiales bacterium]|nr:glycolate oxidase subunit GlcE [Burkholderiales bacterium]